MSAKGVLITSHDRSGNLISRSSAVAFGDLILLLGDHLIPLAKQTKWKKLFKSILPTLDQNAKASHFIDGNIEFSVFEEEIDGIVLPETVERTGRRVVTAGVWRCPLVEESLQTFRLVEDDSCLSLFVLLKTPGDSVVPLQKRIVHFVQSLELPVRGGNVIVESTPGGMHAFMNTLSYGVVARVCGQHGCIFLTDATVHTESTGAPVYNATHSRYGSIMKESLLGVVLGRVGELNDFTCGIALRPVLVRLAPNARIPSGLTQHANVRRLADETVVMITSGNLQGSGVVVDARRGVVVTCFHVTQNDSSTVRIHHKGNVFVGDVIFTKREFDLAVIKTPENSFDDDMNIATSPAETGDAVYVAGFPNVLPFRERDLRPFIAHGYVSKSLPHALICNCSVSKGSSGGAIIRNGELLGLVSLMETGQSGFAFAVPAALFRDNVRKCVETDDVTQLKSSETEDGSGIRFWKMDNCKI